MEVRIMSYQKVFIEPYAPGGFVDQPNKSTEVTADILNNYTTTFKNIESYLESQSANDIKYNDSKTIKDALDELYSRL